LSEGSLKPLMDSLVLEGLQTPIEVHKTPDGKYRLIKGHCRVHALRLLADRHAPGFARDMPVPAVEVLGATHEDLLVPSVADNEVRQNFTPVERLLIARKFHDAGVPAERGAGALGVSVKTYQRDLRVARHLWMVEHIIRDHVGHTAA